MKKKLSFAVGLILLLTVVFVFWQTLPIHVDRTLTAYIYSDGEADGETTVTIDGKISRPFLSSNREQSYAGLFQIGCLEKTSRGDTSARIHWYDGDCQLIFWCFKGDFFANPEFYTGSELVGIDEISADRQLKNIRISLSNGTVISTSPITY